MIEHVARSSAGELRAGTAPDVEAGLADLYLRQAHHRRRARVSTVVALALAVGLGWGAGTALTRADTSQGPTPARPVPSRAGDPVCDDPRVDCLGGRTYRFALTAPVQWRVPSDFEVNLGAGMGALNVEAYREGKPDAGVSVLERVRASVANGTAPARGVADSPRGFVDWVATRPFLAAGTPERTRIDGRRAWQVLVTLSRSAGPGDSRCNGYACHAVTYQPGQSTGIWADMAARYTAFRVPGVGTTVVWSWVFSGDTRDLAQLDAAVHGLSWPGG
jgi:hypothetical protein